MHADDLSRYLDSLERDGRYRVIETIKSSLFETTERVMLAADDGTESGPFIRKTIERESGMGGAYERIFEAQNQGMRFEHIPRIVDFYLRDNQIVVVTEYVAGITLLDLVYEQDPSVALAAQVYPRLCDAVIELHERFDPPIIHRDLKPSNVIVAGDAVTIIDFGIAREFKESASADTTQFGTRAYAPPEQFGFGQTTVKSDVYALGMLLYFLLTEKNPSPKSVEKRFKDADIPEPLRAIIDTATAFDPNNRYADVRTLKSAFEQSVLGAGPDKHAATAASRTEASPAPTARANGAAPTGSPVVMPSPVMPPTADAWQANAASRPNRSKALDTLGRIWNILVLACYALFLYGCISTFVERLGGSGPPLWYNALAYLVIVPVFTGAIAYAILDKRRLKERFPVLARPKLWHMVLFYVLLTVFLVLVVRLMNMAIGI